MWVESFFLKHHVVTSLGKVEMCVCPRILNDSTKWGCSISFTIRPLHPIGGHLDTTAGLQTAARTAAPEIRDSHGSES